MIDTESTRKFEIPYNFDINYIDALNTCGLINNSIEYIYMAPFHEDYMTILRADPYGSRQLTRDQYVMHIQKIRKFFDGKMQLLLQKKDKIMPLETLKWYLDLGFTCFCCGNPEQAKLIKEYDNNLTVIGSIVLHLTRKDLEADYNNKYYEKYFDKFVLDFSYGRHIEKIKILPETKKYMILVNSYCNNRCRGDQHWNIKTEYDPFVCPGKIFETHDFAECVLIRPMDLKYFDPYIDVYKIQDRSWPTADIIRDIILYTTDYTLYPGIEYSETIYDTDDRM